MVSSISPSVLMSSRPTRDDARQILGQVLEDRRPALGIARRGDEAARLVVEEQPRALGRRAAACRRRARRRRADVEGGAVELLAVDDDAALGDPGLGVAARAKPGARHHFGDALAFRFSGGRRRARRECDGRRSPELGACRSSRPWRFAARGRDCQSFGLLCLAGCSARTGDEFDLRSDFMGSCAWRLIDGAAFEEARAAAARGEVPVGAAIVRDGAIHRARRQPHDRRPRPDRPCRNSGDPRGRPRSSARNG